MGWVEVDRMVGKGGMQVGVNKGATPMGKNPVTCEGNI